MNLSRLYEDALLAGPERPCLIVDEDVLTYRQLHKTTLANARALQCLGVRPGDRVAFHMGNRLDIAPLCFGCFYIGAVAAPLRCCDTAPELARAISDCGAKILVIGKEQLHALPAVHERAPGLEQCFVIGGDPAGKTPSWEEQTLGGACDPPLPHVSADNDPAVVIDAFTGADTPKSATHSVHTLASQARDYAATLKLAGDARFLTAATLCRGAHLADMLLPMALCGGAVICSRSQEPHAMHWLMRRWRPTYANLPPGLLRAMLDAPGFDPALYAGLTTLFVDGDAIPRDLYDDYAAKTGGRLRKATDMNECGG